MDTYKDFFKYQITRREFIKKTSLASLALFTSPIWLPEIAYTFDRKKLTFSEIYPVPFYKKDWFVPAVIAGTIIVTAAILFFTAGAGAPAAAPGVSTIASWIGGGGAGSYMAGLSTVGSWFGGNAILGAAILNSISLTFLGGAGAAGKASLSMGATVAAIADLALTGIQIKSAFFEKKQEGNDGFIFQIKTPYEIGSGPIQGYILKPLKEVSDKISDIQKDIVSLHQDICKAIAENDKQELKEIQRKIKNKQRKLKSLETVKEELQITAMKVLRNNIKNLSIENLIVLTVIANNAINQELFEKSLKVLNRYANIFATEKSFVDYLNGIYYLGNLNYEKARYFLYKALHQEPYVVEIGIALILALSENYFKHKNEILKIVKIIEDNFDDDNYEGKNLQILYYHAGTIALANGDYPSALNFFKKAYDSLPFIVKHIPIPSIGFLANLNEVKNFFQMPIAISYKLMGKTKIAEELLNEILERCNKVPCKEECRQKYLTWYNNAEKKMEVSK